MKGKLVLDPDITAEIDKLVANYIFENVLRRTVMINNIYKVSEEYGRVRAATYTVEFQDSITELAGTTHDQMQTVPF